MLILFTWVSIVTLLTILAFLQVKINNNSVNCEADNLVLEMQKAKSIPELPVMKELTAAGMANDFSYTVDQVIQQAYQEAIHYTLTGKWIPFGLEGVACYCNECTKPKAIPVKYYGNCQGCGIQLDADYIHVGGNMRACRACYYAKKNSNKPKPAPVDNTCRCGKGYTCLKHSKYEAICCVKCGIKCEVLFFTFEYGTVCTHCYNQTKFVTKKALGSIYYNAVTRASLVANRANGL